MKEKIRYKDLSIPLKMIVVGGWFNLIILFLYFLVGFIEGVVSTI